MNASVLFDDIWYQVFYFLVINDIFNVIQTNKHFFTIGMYHLKISNELLRVWFNGHTLFSKNTNLFQKIKPFVNYKFIIDQNNGLKMGYRCNKIRNAVSICIISYWGLVKKIRIKFPETKFISVHSSGLHKHSENGVYLLHIMNWNQTHHLKHFFDMKLNMEFISHIRVEMKPVQNSLISSKLCTSQFQQNFAVGSNYFRFFKDTFKLNEIILESHFNEKFKKALFVCKNSCYFFDAQLKFPTFIKNFASKSENLYFDVLNNQMFTIQKNQSFFVFTQSHHSNEFTMTKFFQVQSQRNSKEQSFQIFCPISNKILVL